MMGRTLSEPGDTADFYPFGGMLPVVNDRRGKRQYGADPCA